MIFQPLAELNFGTILSEAVCDTQSGQDLVNKYRRHLLNNEVSCGLVNNFVSEAQNYRFDQAINGLLLVISEHIQKAPTSWKLKSVSENIKSNTSSYNYLNRNAANQVDKLLEGMEEKDVVNYIRSGALKNIMFCEAIRNVVKDVYRDQVEVVTESYTATTPVSFVEKNNDAVYFEIAGSIYKISENKIEEAYRNEVSETFVTISQLLESRYANFDDAGNLTIDFGNYTYTIEGCKSEQEEEECDDCEKKVKKTNKKDGKVREMNATKLREENKLVESTLQPNLRREAAFVLEALAQTLENFDNIALLDNSKIYTTKNDKFLVIENHENCYAKSLGSNRTTPWTINKDIVESLKFIKEQTKIDLTNEYGENINESFELSEAQYQEEIEKQVEESEMRSRKQKIEELTEAFKNDPAKLAVLAKLAESLNEE